MSVKIYIDQGHNPVNPNAGAEGNGLREQDVVYKIGIILAGLLDADPDFEARVSRPAPDTQLGYSTTGSLAARVNGANSWGADYFVSLHTNAALSPSASGSEAFSYSVSSAGYRLGRSILRALSAETGLYDRGVTARPGLYVLRKTRMPAVLVELGFITNPGDAALMNENPDLFAVGVYNGIVNFIRG